MIPRLPHRVALVAMICAVWTLSLNTPGRAQNDPTLPDTTGSGTWVIDPPHPCVDDQVTLWVRAFHSTPCDSFISAYGVSGGPVVIRTLTREGYFCFAAPIPYSIPILLGSLPAGSHSLVIQHRRLTLHLDGTLDSVTVTEGVTFGVSSQCEGPAPIPYYQLPFVTRVFTDPEPACPDRPTTLGLWGAFNNGCGNLISATNEGGRVSVVLSPYPQPNPVACPAVLKPWQAYLGLGYFQPGTHEVLIHLTLLGSGASWPPVLQQRYVGRFDFAVVSACPTPPPPQPLPFVEFIQIGPSRPDSSGIICSQEPFRVTIGGRFPSDCIRLRGAQLRDVAIPPIVQLYVVNEEGCRPCAEVATPWDTTLILPGLPTGDYGLNIQMYLMGCNSDVGSGYVTTVPFQVAPVESCEVNPTACVRGHWVGDDTNLCHAFVTPQTEPSWLTFSVATGAALSGLQGTLRFHEPGLEIKALEPVGPAVGMHVSWVPTSDGARFVMFADQGAPIPATTTLPVPVLRVGVGPSPIRVDWPPIFHLEAGELLGADLEARAVPQCFFRALPPVANICVERPCDYNSDGSTDVRDLVGMVRCVTGQSICVPNVEGRFDCDRNGQFQLDDVMCCARTVLRWPQCLDCPVDSVRVSTASAELGVPERTATGVRVPVRIGQTFELAAAKLGLTFPTDRYRLSEVALGNWSPYWLEVHETSASGATLGLIRVSPVVDLGEHSPNLDVMVHLELLPGMTPGGEIRLESADFSAYDGVRLELGRGQVVQPLGAGGPLRLSRAQPNPFAGETRFSVTIESGTSLEVGIYDLAGRLVNRLYRGSKDPGAHQFRWNGRNSQGGLAREGIYFYRVTGAGQTAAGKVALLRLR